MSFNRRKYNIYLDFLNSIEGVSIEHLDDESLEIFRSLNFNSFIRPLVKRDRKKGLSKQQLATKYGVSFNVIHGILYH